ncbi:hypothetical protein LQZ19_10915 [Treponema primitia]|uniref:hypothetical protein n=1 Tax=Treponema primitia TaxID=88058 RepID=UPI0039812F7E
MLGWLVEVKKTEENGGTIVAQWSHTPYGDLHAELRNLAKQGKAVFIHDGGGYPYIYSAKTIDVMPLIEQGLNARDDVAKDGSFVMLGYGIVQDILVATTKEISDVPFCPPDETLIITLWDLS